MLLERGHHADQRLLQFETTLGSRVTTLDASLTDKLSSFDSSLASKIGSFDGRLQSLDDAIDSRMKTLEVTFESRAKSVTDTIDGVLCVTMARPVSRSPQMTLNTPGGKNSAAISANNVVVAGVVSDGFNTMALPAANAGANFHTAIIMG
jgi:hypothetical protein